MTLFKPLQSHKMVIFARFAGISKILSIAICSFLFGILMKDNFCKYSNKTTTTGMRNELLSSLSNLQIFLSIHNCLKSNPLLERQETTIYNEIVGDIYEEPLAQQFGRCFSYYSYEDFELNSGRDYSFKTAHDLRIFFHPTGDELWFTGFFSSHMKFSVSHLISLNSQILVWH